jgi:hypothetical protein
MGETPSLKALAAKVLRRDKTQDSQRDTPGERSVGVSHSGYDGETPARDVEISPLGEPLSRSAENRAAGEPLERYDAPAPMRAGVSQCLTPLGRDSETVVADADLVERLARALAAPRPWQRVTDQDRALDYFRGEAKRRLSLLPDPKAQAAMVARDEVAVGAPKGCASRVCL